MSKIKTLVLCTLTLGLMFGAIVGSAAASCMTTPTGAAAMISGEGINADAVTLAINAVGSPTCWRPEPGEAGVGELHSRVVVSHYSLGLIIEAMREEGFRSGYPLMVALENIRRDLIDHDVTSAAYIYPSNDCHVYAQAANGQPDPAEPVAALWWAEGCGALKELIGVAIADHMDGAVLEARATAKEYFRQNGVMNVSLEPAPVSFAWLFVAYHNVDVSKLPAELGFVDRLAERLQTVPYRVQDKDTLSHLALALTGVAENYNLLYALNRERVSNPDVILAGETIAMPPGVADWTMVPAGENPTATSSRLYGTPVFASTVAGLCGGEAASTEYSCYLPMWRDIVAVAATLGELGMQSAEGNSRSQATGRPAETNEEIERMH